MNNQQTDESVLSEFDDSEDKTKTPMTSQDFGLDNDWQDILAKKFQMGWDTVANSRNNVDLMNRDDISDADELTLLKAGAQKVGTGFNQADYEAQPWVLRAVDDAAQVLPGIGDSALQGGVGGAITAGTSALASRVVPHPLIQTAAGALGFGQGFTAGSAKSIWEQSAGELYGELRQAGVSKKTAKTMAYTFGSLNASLEFAGLKTLQRIAGGAMGQANRAALQRTLQTPFVKQIESNMLSRLGMNVIENVATETGTEGLQQSSSELAKVVSAMAEKLPADTYTNWNTATANTKQAMLQALGASLVLGTAGQGAGLALGQGAGMAQGKGQQAASQINAEVLNQLEGKTPTEILQLLGNGLKETPNIWENPTQENSVVYDEQGNPYIRATIKEEAAPAQAPQAIVKGFGGQGQLQLSDIVNNPQVVIDSGLSSQNQINLDIQQELDALFSPQNQQEFESFQSAHKVPGEQLRLPLVEWRPMSAVETQARLNQINSDLTTMKRENSKLESNIRLAEETGRPIGKLQDRWNKLGQTMDALQSERDTLESGLGTTDVQGPNYGKLRIKQLAKLTDKITAQAQKITNLQEKEKLIGARSRQQGFNSGAMQTRRAIKRLQQDLKNLVRASINKEGTGFTQEERNVLSQMDAYIAGITTPNQASKAAAQITQKARDFEQRRSESINERDRRKTYDKVVKLVEGNRIRLQSGHPSAQLPVDVTNRLKELRALLKGGDSALRIKEYEFNQKVGDTPIDQLSPEDADQMQLLNFSRALMSGDALSRNISAASIAQWVQDGQEQIRQQRQALADQKSQDVNDALVSMDYKPGETKYATSTRATRLKHFYNDIQAGTWTWNTLLDRLTPTDRNHTLTQMLDDTSNRESYLANKEITTQNLMRHLQDSLPENSKVNLLQKIADDSRLKYAVQYDSQTGPQTIVLTKAQMIDAVLKYRDESLHDALREGNKFSLPGDVAPGRSFIERILSTFTPADIALTEGMLQFYKDYHASVNEKYRQEYNVDLPMRDNYTPVSREGYKVDPPFSKDGLQFWSLLPGSAKTRAQSKLPIKLDNPFDVALNHIDQWEYWKAYTDKLRTINNVMTDPTVRSHIASEYGSGTLHVMENFVARFMKNEAVPTDPTDSYWSAMRADLSRHALGLKPVSSFLTQLTSGTGFWADYSPIEILKGATQMALHPKQTEDAFRSSAILRDRFKSGSSIALKTALQQHGLFGATLQKITGSQPDVMDVKKYEALNRLMFGGIMLGDAGGTRLFGGPIYWAEKARGKSDAEAIQTVARLAEQTQQGASVSQTPKIFATPGVNTLLTMFTQQPVQSIGKSGTYINDFMHSKKSMKDWMELGHKMSATWFLPGLLLGLVKTLPSWLAPQNDDDERKRSQIHDILGSALMGPASGVPYIGDVLQALWFQAAKPLVGVDMSKRADFVGGTPIMQMLFENPARAFKLWSKLNKEEDPFKMALTDDTREKDEMKFAAALAKTGTSFLGVPGQVGNVPIGVLDQASRGDTVGAALALGGWAPGALQQRASEEQDPLNVDLLKGLEQSNSPYDIIESMLSSFWRNTPKQEKTSTTKELDDLLQELSNGTTRSNESSQPK